MTGAAGCRCSDFDVAVVGAGPAGLAAALAADASGASCVLVERDGRAGGVLKQCVHDGFGLVRWGERLAGPEHARRDVRAAEARGIPLRASAFVTAVRRDAASGLFMVDLASPAGIERLRARALVLATGCRERTDRQVFIHGDRPAGILTAGQAQYFVNVAGKMPGRNVVVLGSGDIGLIMARRLTLEGARVVGVYEARPEPSGLARNVAQCLDDFGIPLHLSATVASVHGRSRVESVSIRRLGAEGGARGGEEVVPCDTLVLSVGLIPENELAEALGVPLDPATKGPAVDQTLMTAVDGVFACGNALRVSDLADYASEDGEIAGKHAAEWASGARGARDLVSVARGGELLFAVPQSVDRAHAFPPVLSFRSRRTLGPSAFALAAEDGKPVLSRRYAALRPQEMERVALDAAAWEAARTAAGFRLDLEANDGK